MERACSHPTFDARPEIRSLTGARFVAAILVVGFHYLHVSRTGPLSTWINGALSRGYLGVPFFLILSGFILTYNYAAVGTETRARALDMRQFWTARFARVYPTYFLALILQVPFFFLSFRYVQTGQSIWFNRCVIGSATLLLVQSFFPPEIFQSWNEPGWTLSAEAFFYLLFPFTNRRIGRLGPIGAISLLLVLAIAVCLIYLAIIPRLPAYGSILGLHDTFFWSRFPPFLWPLFLAGSALCPLFVFARDRQTFCSIAGLASTVFAILLVVLMGLEGARHISSRPGADLIYSAMLVALIFTMAFDRGPICKLLGCTPMLLLGESSYALYILQEPLAIFLNRAWRVASHWHWLPIGLPPIVLVILLVAISVLTHLFFEQPARRLVRRWVTKGDVRSQVKSHE